MDRSIVLPEFFLWAKGKSGDFITWVAPSSHFFSVLNFSGSSGPKRH